MYRVEPTCEPMRHLVHELNTPLAAMAAALELLASDPSDAATLDAALSAQRHVVSLIARARALLPLNRPLSGTPVRLAELLTETASMLEPLATSAGCSLSLDTDAAVAFADRHAVRQIVVNLLANSFKYAPGTRVRISSGTSPTGVWLEVSDEGPGIPLEAWGEMLAAGSRLVEHADIPGEGLGLALSAELAVAMHGRLDLHPSRGAAVRLHLPAA